LIFVTPESVNFYKESNMKKSTMQRIIPVLPLCMLLLFTGCTTVDQQRRGDARRQIEIQNRQVELQKLRARMQDLSTAQENIYTRLDQLEAAHRDTQTGVSELQKAILDLDAKRAADREAIVNSLSKKIAGLLKTSGSSGRQGGSTTGREHPVQPGETLSAIASAYGVSIRAIIKANHLKNPDNLRAGQKLFIPD
jgi:LysM repeat protein